MTNNLSQCFLIVLFLAFLGQAQEQNEMEQLQFLIGNWQGTSTVFKNDTIYRQETAVEKIQYLLDKEIITIDLNSSILKLHTVIYFDKTENSFYYCPYYKRGTGKKYKGKIEDGKFIVSMKDNYRLIFLKNRKGEFIEYGELFENNKWSKKFEDVFMKSP